VGNLVAELHKESLNDQILELTKTIAERDQELAGMKQELSRMQGLKLLGERLPMIAHEMRNSLMSIRGGCQFINMISKDGELINTYSSKAVDEADRMVKLMENLLEFSRPIQVHKEEHDLAELIHGMLLTATIEINKKLVRIRNEITEKLLIFTDGSKLHQVILNTFRNAMEAVSIGGEICLSACKDQEWVRILIQDNGVGIPEASLKKIGTSFYTTKVGGNGIGVATSMKIMNELGGSFHIDSIEGEGTTISLKLPIA